MSKALDSLRSEPVLQQSIPDAANAGITMAAISRDIYRSIGDGMRQIIQLSHVEGYDLATIGQQIAAMSDDQKLAWMERLIKRTTASRVSDPVSIWAGSVALIQILTASWSQYSSDTLFPNAQAFVGPRMSPGDPIHDLTGDGDG